MRTVLVCTLLVWLHACNAQQAVSVVKTDNGVVLLLDSAQAARSITTDRYNHFFELVTAGEMSIQMKQALSAQPDRGAMVEQYKNFLKSDVENFTVQESQFVERVMRDVYHTCQQVAPGLCPDTLLLIKTKGRHYGDGVYYTRDNCIIIPADVLRTRNRPAFTETMFHEIFHIYSRLHPEKQRALYRLIGFESIGLDQLRMPEKLAARVLYNPDGVDFAQKITLKMEDGSTVFAIPILSANHTGFTPQQPDFFDYVQFNLFPIELQADGGWKITTKADGLSSPLNVSSIPDFYRQIKDNTGYIIHPDEILADNFAILMKSKDNAAVTAKFSPGGKKLLADLEKALKGN